MKTELNQKQQHKHDYYLVLKNVIADKLQDPVKERKDYGKGEFTV